jgi:hypothetical protein
MRRKGRPEREIRRNTSRSRVVIEGGGSEKVRVSWECQSCGRMINPDYKSCPYCDPSSNDDSPSGDNLGSLDGPFF